ncbi:hypothetical protein [Acaryochloris sp. IP29b_bin.148]|uniref:hypothetical protein n=1 Tax=Acaryochloris sp. IP29b_bin.148 TaxID=2969218 RepID=UPI002633E930|nr:hypothetical protein [Acaryochloris sp. IP29b_bin.148]
MTLATSNAIAYLQSLVADDNGLVVELNHDDTPIGKQVGDMELKSQIDKTIQINLMSYGITFPIDNKGKILIHEFWIDTQANAGMLYIQPKNKLPKGALPFLVGCADFVYGVFHFEGKAAIIEVSTMALDGEIKDFYLSNQE